jgi:hypothetical protein
VTTGANAIGDSGDGIRGEMKAAVLGQVFEVWMLQHVWYVHACSASWTGCVMMVHGVGRIAGPAFAAKTSRVMSLDSNNVHTTLLTMLCLCLYLSLSMQWP